MITRLICLLFLAALFFTIPAAAQDQLVPRLSPKASVTQTIGISEITITYSRPGVKGRTIWGKLVPMGEIWRMGANENTTISFSNLVKIDGHELEAGVYGMHAIPTDSTWTIIFSKDSKLWGSMGYKRDADALRITVTPQKGAFKERLTFDIDDVTEESALVMMAWENLRVGFKIEFATQSLVFEKINAQLENLPVQGVNYILQNNLNPEIGLKWIEASIIAHESYWNVCAKALLLEKAGRRADAVAALLRALELGKAMERLPFDYIEMQELLRSWQ